MKREVLVVGFGSAGKRHTKNLLRLGIKPYVISSHPDYSIDAKFISTLDGFKDLGNITHVVITSPTSEHFKDVNKLAKKGIMNFLIEKPLECTGKVGLKLLRIAKKKRLNVYVGYNMRFLSSLNILKSFVKKNISSIRIVEIVAGQYLPDWRKNRDYRSCYSASRKRGGGVDLDLSHEIDYILWIFGNSFRKKLIYRATISKLKISSPDIFILILDYGRFVINLMLDYIRSPKERSIRIICEKGENLEYDCVSNWLVFGKKKVCNINDLDESYLKMMRAFLEIDKKNKKLLCSMEEATDVLKVLEV